MALASLPPSMCPEKSLKCSTPPRVLLVKYFETPSGSSPAQPTGGSTPIAPENLSRWQVDCGGEGFKYLMFISPQAGREDSSPKNK